jgi:hypothetical protein
MIRIATWNLERPKLKGWARNPRIINKIKEVNADLWVFTETNASISPGDDYFSVARLPVPKYHSLGESFTTIWTKWRMLRHIETNTECGVCVEIDSPLGPMIVYGTIITYANDPGPNGKSKLWIEHRKSIDEHAKDWTLIKQAYPHHHFIVAGDFNQCLDDSGWYHWESYQQLKRTLQDCSLECLTRNKFKELSRLTVDHVCASEGLKSRVVNEYSWEGRNDDGPMSDHNGVMVELRTS